MAMLKFLWGTLFAFALLAACGESTQPSTIDAGRAGAGHEATQTATSRGLPEGGDTAKSAFPACEPNTDSPPPGLDNLGIHGKQAAGTQRGIIMIADNDRLEIAAGDDALQFNWVGAPLSTAFSVGDAVELYGPYRLASFGWGGWSVVRSSSATAAVLNAAPFMVLSTTPGATTAPGAQPWIRASDFPQLQYTLDSCCSVPSRARAVDCDFLPVEASYAGSSVAIASGTTARLGTWSITNAQSSYSIRGEYVWRLAATLLGPATASVAEDDAGI